MTMSAVDLEQLEAFASAATHAPWHPDTTYALISARGSLPALITELRAARAVVELADLEVRAADVYDRDCPGGDELQIQLWSNRYNALVQSIGAAKFRAVYAYRAAVSQ